MMFLTSVDVKYIFISEYEGATTESTIKAFLRVFMI